MIFLLLSLLLIAIKNYEMPQYFAYLKFFFHNLCLKQIPDSKYLSFQAGVLCGKNISEFSLLDPLLKSSLYHLTVVSGAHLVLIISAFLFLKKRLKNDNLILLLNLGLSFFLPIYIFMCDFQAPIVRGFWGLLFNKINSKFKLLISDIQASVIATLTCIILIPAWAASLSLILSATCSIILSFKKTPESLLLKQIYIYLFTIPLLIGWGNLHPIGIIINLILTPYIVFIIFPLSLLGCFINVFQIIYILSMDLLYAILNYCVLPVNLSTEVKLIQIHYLWLYYLLLFFVFNYIERKNK